MNIQPLRLSRIPVQDIETNPIQPDGRVTPDGQKDGIAIRHLRTNIESTGVLMPIAVQAISERPGKYYVCDGHRRLYVARLLGETVIDCVVLPGTLSFVGGFIKLNKDTKKIDGWSWLDIWCKAPSAHEAATDFPVKQIAYIRQLEKWLGRSGVTRLRNKKYSPEIVTTVNTVVKYSEGGLNGREADVISWLSSGIKGTSQGEFKGWITRAKDNANWSPARMARHLTTCVLQSRPIEKAHVKKDKGSK